MDIILITTDMHLRTSINKLLGFQVLVCKSLQNLSVIENNLNTRQATVIIDDKLDNFHTVLYHLISEYPQIRIIILTSNNKITKSIISIGNITILSRPFSISLSEMVLKNQQKTISCTEELDKTIIGHSESIIKIKKLIKELSKTEHNIFIYGETGTGKEIIAKAIHNTRFPNKEMITENCSLIDGTLMDCLLFGHKKGSFTDAITDQEGLVEKANGSTLFLDEIEDLSITGQAKLLRLLESGEYRSIGNINIKYSHFALICATNIRKEELLRQNRIRKDFYHRISKIQIEIPPLRERLEDIPELTYYYEKKQNYSSYINNFDNFFKYSWPGNVRELFYQIDRIHFYNQDSLTFDNQDFVN